MKQAKPSPAHKPSSHKKEKKADLAFQEIFVKDIEETRHKIPHKKNSPKNIKAKTDQLNKQRLKHKESAKGPSGAIELSSQKKGLKKREKGKAHSSPIENKAPRHTALNSAHEAHPLPQQKESGAKRSPAPAHRLASFNSSTQALDKKSSGELNSPPQLKPKDSKTQQAQGKAPALKENKALSSHQSAPLKSPPIAKKDKNGAGDPEALQVLEARKLQMMSRDSDGAHPASSPLQMHIVRSESLRIAQERIDSLKEELDELRKINQSLSSASGILQDKNDQMKSRLEEMEGALAEEKNTFKNEKEIFTSALADATEKISHLQDENKKLEERLSNEFQGIREREGSLESRIEILKMENTALQREKDKKIIELKKNLRKSSDILQAQQKKSRILHEENIRLREGSRRAVSTLRALIFHLEGLRASAPPPHGETSPSEKKSA